MQFLFWISLIIIINSYFIYPLFIYTISKFSRSRKTNYVSIPVSIMIAAYNEEKVIKERIENLSKLNYDFSKLEVLVGSDNSSDDTNEILKDLEKKYPWLRVFVYENRQGKAGVINSLSEHCKNNIWIFSDANTVFDRNSVKELVKHFNNEDIGGVCGKLVLTKNDNKNFEGLEEKAYWEFESNIKKYEGKLGIVIGANGGNFAIRKSLFDKIPLKKAVTDDLFLSLLPLKKGKKVLYEEKSKAFEQVGKSITEEFRRKIRFASTNFQTLYFFPKLLLPTRPLIAYALFSHKISRWLNPWLLFFLFFTSLSLALEHKVGFNYFVFLQILFYISGFLGFLLSVFKKQLQPFSIIFYFLITNIALMIGFINFLLKKHTVVWTPTKR